jgi:hypothetical protein
MFSSNILRALLVEPVGVFSKIFMHAGIISPKLRNLSRHAFQIFVVWLRQERIRKTRQTPDGLGQIREWPSFLACSMLYWNGRTSPSSPRHAWFPTFSYDAIDDATLRSILGRL